MPNTYTPLRYPGGKTKFYSYVRTILELNNLLGKTYVEPFAGGAGLALKLLLKNDVSRIVINDYDPAIYSFWHSILFETERFCATIDSTLITTTEWEKQRKIYQAQDKNDAFSLGFSTFFLNRTNVSGVVNGGMIGGRNQDGPYKIDARFNKENLIKKIRDIAAHKDQIVVINQDAKRLLSTNYLEKYDQLLINLDPPYVCKGPQLYKNAFCADDHRDLFHLISQCDQKWIVTYDICSFVDELYQAYRSSYLDVTYSIQSSKKAKEYIFFSNNLLLPPEINLRE